MNKQKMMGELDEFLNIPQFERIIFHKIEELKDYLKDEIDHYRELKRYFRKLAYGDMQVLSLEGDSHGDREEYEAENDGAAGGLAGSGFHGGNREHERERNQTYRFELNRGNEDQWNAAKLEPPPPPGYDIHDIIPEEIIDYITAYETNMGKMETIKGLSLPTVKGIRFDLHFTKYSGYHVLGTIKAHHEEKEDREEIYIYTWKEPEESDYKELIYYMRKYPPLRMYFFTELHMKMKPLILGKMVDVTVSSQPVELF
jgi:hypothetical protein